MKSKQEKLIENMRVVVRIKCRKFVKSKAGFTSKDACPELMEALFKFLELPYENNFASGFVEIPTEGKTGWAKRPGMKLAPDVPGAYGKHAFILNEAAIKTIRLVCAGDFQNVVCQLMNEILLGKPLAVAKTFARENQFREIPRNAPLDEIERILRWADNNKPKHKGSYAEVRVFHAVRPRDGSWDETISSESHDLLDDECK